MSDTRVAAIVGPYTAGKTALLESILSVTGSLSRKGDANSRNRVGDTSDEARSREMSVEMAVAETDYLGEKWTFLDCPGSIEFQEDARAALMVCDIAIVVLEPEPERAVMAAPLLKYLDQRDIPHVVFLNRILETKARVRETLDALQAVSDRPLVLREVPIREGGVVTGYVDLLSERAYHYEPGEPSSLIRMPETVRAEEEEARQGMLESLADFDDHLLEELLEDIVPASAEVNAAMAKDVREDLIVPVLFGEAEADHGVRRLLKSLRHDGPSPAETAARLGVGTEPGVLVQAFKTLHAPHTGRLSVVRVWHGEIDETFSVDGQKIGGLFALNGVEPKKLARAGTGDIVALARVEAVKTGDLIEAGGTVSASTNWPDPLAPLFSVALTAQKQGDEVKLTESLARLCEEDPSLSVEQNADTNQLLLWGQGDIHLKTAIDKLKRAYHVDVAGEKPAVPYQETIGKAVAQHARHKKQSGGHGQFGDVHVTIAPQPRGGGFSFTDTVVGGSVPKQFIPAVEAGVREALAKGPLGFPVVDVAVTLTDGQHHPVDSSEAAFKAAGALAMREGLPQCAPVLLEPILAVNVAVPSEWTSKAQRALSQRRAQILGFDQREGWKGWDVIAAMLPQSEMHDLIIELRSITMGVGTFSWTFDHMQELVGKPADQIVAAQ